MKILAVETSCDETCAAVIEDGKILSNIVSSQIELHKVWGGVVPGIAKRAHDDKIDEVVDQALSTVNCPLSTIDAVAVTRGPGLAIALEVGIKKAISLGKPIIAVNHIEGHVLSPLMPEVQFPALGLVVSGKHTELIYIEKIGTYKILAETIDDALGEAGDKAARMLGLGYPGGPAIEKNASLGNPKNYPLPIPMLGREDLNQFSYSGLKAAMYRLVEKLKMENGQLTVNQVQDLAAVFQDTAFKHLTRVLKRSIEQLDFSPKHLLVGGGVAANQELRSRLTDLAEGLGMQVAFPAKGLYGDNAGMIGIAGYYKVLRNEFADPANLDRLPRWRIDEPGVTIDINKALT